MFTYASETVRERGDIRHQNSGFWRISTHRFFRIIYMYIQFIPSDAFASWLTDALDGEDPAS